MKTVFENHLIRMAVIEEHSILKVEWQPKTESMNNEEFKEMTMKIADFVIEYSLKSILSDTRQFFFSIEPEIQIWAAENTIVPAAIHSLKNVAYLVSSDLFSQISVEQLMQEEPALQLTTRYFDDEQEAFEWVLKA